MEELKRLAEARDNAAEEWQHCFDLALTKVLYAGDSDRIAENIEDYWKGLNAGSEA